MRDKKLTMSAVVRHAVLAVCVMVVVMGWMGSAGAGSVNIETVVVGDPGNLGEWSGTSYCTENCGYDGPDRICGAVNYTYNIGKYEVTAGQYAAFLNDVAKTDTHGLYNSLMWTEYSGCKILQSGSPGSFIYSVAPDYSNRPVNFVSLYDSMRFANWMNSGNTEFGSYTFNNGVFDGNIPDRTPGTMTKWFLTSEDEWYKAAYYKGGRSNDYWLYPTQSDTAPGYDLTDPYGNNANYKPWQQGTIEPGYYTTVVGEFENSGSYYGTFDQGGNVWEWNEAVINGVNCGMRGGRWGFYDELESFERYYCDLYSYPDFDGQGVGFRLSSISPAPVPEPATLSLLGMGLAGLAVRRLRKRS